MSTCPASLRAELRPIRNVANSENLLVRLRLGVYAPSAELLPDAKDRFTDLWRATEAQLEAIEAFSEIDWRERV